MESEADFANAEIAVFSSIESALRPPPRMGLSEWSETYRFLPSEVSANPGKWSNELFPFLVEIMECLNPWHPSETVTFAKSAQVGGTEIGLNFMFAIADMWPGPTMMVHPTIQAAGAWVREKLSASMKATSKLDDVIRAQKSRDSSSTTLFKPFDGGFWILTGSNSSADLSSKSIRYVVKEELDRWAADVDGQGDPENLVDARQKSYQRSGKNKSYQASTPTIKGDSRIWAAYERGDRRRYHVPCPECNEEQVLNFFPDSDGKGGLLFNKEAPYEAKYCCRHCGSIIDHYQKDWMLSNGRWIAEFPDSGRQPSFHINALYSPVSTWDKMAEAFLHAKDNPKKLKAFVNLELGEPWEEKGDAPEWERLFAAREDYKFRAMPHGVYFITAAADVQGDGIYYEVVGWGKDGQSWSMDYGFLEGDTADASNVVWKNLTDIRARKYVDINGNHHSIDAFGVDSGFNTNTVYLWCRKTPGTYALKGRDGWFHPAIGTPTLVDVNARGRKIRRGVKLWPVGTWGLKSELYANLRKLGVSEGQDHNPTGYCHFCQSHDENYFKQLTAEYLVKSESKKGKQKSEWRANAANHLHDCRIYNMSLAEHLGLSTLTEDEWRAIAKSRRLEEKQPDMLDGIHSEIVNHIEDQPPPKKPAERSEGYLGSADDYWS